jgi:hypothetical protein
MKLLIQDNNEKKINIIATMCVLLDKIRINRVILSRGALISGVSAGK